MNKLKVPFLLCILFLLSSERLPESFLQVQLRFQRVRDALKNTEIPINNLLKNKQLKPSNFECAFIAYKEENILEVHTRKKGQKSFSILKSYPICYASGELGPKRKEGDRQVPEGLYHISNFNPASNYHLSLQISYPNASDKILSDRTKPGGEIFIHGNCVSIGCLAMRDSRIEELYLLAVRAKSNGQKVIPVYLFPFKMTRENLEKHIQDLPDSDSRKDFWKQLEKAWTIWNKTGNELNFHIDKKGNYIMHN